MSRCGYLCVCVCFFFVRSCFAGVIGTYAHAPLDEKNGVEGQGLKAGLVAIKGMDASDDNIAYSRQVCW